MTCSRWRGPGTLVASVTMLRCGSRVSNRTIHALTTKGT
jgi:hypothetical protein